MLPTDPVVYSDRFEKGEKLGSGSYGSVYKVYDRLLEEHYAMKIEPYTSRAKRELRALKAVGDTEGCLELIDSFKGSYNTIHMVFTLVGTTLHDHRKKFKNKKMDLKTVLLLADQIILRLRALHGKGYIHRDIKTDNLAMGLGENRSIMYMLDLGLVKQIKTSENRHILMNTGHELIGNSRYCSLNSHRGYTLSRRDDLESLGYLLICMLKGKLPWSENKEYYDIFRKKKASAGELCRDLEPEFAEFLRYARNLDFKQKPDYNYLQNLFKRVSARYNYTYDGVFAWSDKTSCMIAKNELGLFSLDGNRRIELNNLISSEKIKEGDVEAVKQESNHCKPDQKKDDSKADDHYNSKPANVNNSKPNVPLIKDHPANLDNTEDPPFLNDDGNKKRNSSCANICPINTDGVSSEMSAGNLNEIKKRKGNELEQEDLKRTREIY